MDNSDKFTHLSNKACKKQIKYHVACNQWHSLHIGEKKYFKYMHIFKNIINNIYIYFFFFEKKKRYGEVYQGCGGKMTKKKD